MRKAKRVLAVLMLLAVVFSIFTGAVQASPLGDQDDQISEEPPAKDEGGLFERIVAGIVSIPANLIEGIFTWWGHFKPIGKLVFMQGYTDEQKKNLPWEGREPEYVRLWYKTLAYVTAPFMILVVASSAFKLLYAAANPAARSEAMESCQRALVAVLIVALMPVLVSTLMWICSALVDAISGGFNHVAAAAGMPQSTSDWGAADLAGRKIVTGSVLGTALVRMFMTGIFAYLNVLYIVRKIALTVFYCFTPIAAMIWVINKRSVTMPVLIGEIASNAFMPVAHALVLCTILLFCNVKEIENGSWVTILICLYTLIPLAEVLRNSLQSVIMQWAGLNEAGVASKTFGAIMGLGGVVSLARVGSSLFTKGAPLPGGKLPPGTTTVGSGRARTIGFKPQPVSSPPPDGPARVPGGNVPHIGGFAPQIGGVAPPVYAGPPSAGGLGRQLTSQSGLAGRFRNFVSSHPRAGAAVRFGTAAGRAAAIGFGALAAFTLPAVPGGKHLVKPVAAAAKGMTGLAAAGAYLAGSYVKQYAGKKIGLAAEGGSQIAQKTLEAGRAVKTVGQRAAQKLEVLGFGNRQGPAPVAQSRKIGFRPSVQPQPRAKYPDTGPGRLDGVRWR